MADNVNNNNEGKVKCAICRFVFVFAASMFVLSVVFFIYVKLEQRAVAEKVERVNTATVNADRM